MIILDEKGWIKLYSEFKNWKWYHKQNTKDLFIHCLLSANWKKGKFEDVDVERGSFITTYSKLSEELNLSIQNIRTSISHLKSTGELTITKHSKFLVITVNNYNKYQQTNTITNTQLTRYQHDANTQLTTIEEYKTIEERNSNIEEITNNTRIVEKEEIYKEEKEKKDFFDYDWMSDDSES